MFTINKIYYFNETSEFIKDRLLYSDGLGFIKNSPEFLIDRSYFYNNLIMYNLSGKIHIEQYGTHLTLNANQGILMKLTDKHKYYSDKEFPCEILWIHINGQMCNELINSFSGISNFPIIFSLDKVAENIKKCIIINKNREVSYEFEISKLIYEMMIDILNHTIIKEKKFGETQSELVRAVDRYIQSNINKPISLDELSHNVRMSKYYFCRKFKEQSGVSPAKYIMNKKITQSKNLLIFTNESISNIAESLGFVDQSHFSKVFYKYEHMYPSEYKSKAILY